MKFIVTRPQDDAAELGREIEALGHNVILAPLLDMQPTGVTLRLDGAQAIVATSRNALRVIADGPQRDEALRLPVFVVGAASARLARQLGFSRIVAGDSGARELVALVTEAAKADGGVLVYASGDVVAYDLEPELSGRGYDVRRQVVYEAVEATALPEAAAAAVASGGAGTGVLLMSRRSAEVFMRLSELAGLAEAARGLAYICMSPAVAMGLGEPPPRRLRVAGRPTSEEMLALVKELASNRP